MEGVWLETSICSSMTKTTPAVENSTLWLLQKPLEGTTSTLSAYWLTTFNRKGIAKEALVLLMRYAIAHLNVTSFLARISDKNEASLSLFRNALNFQQESHSDFFAETTLRLKVTPEFKTSLEAQTYAESVYDN